MNFTRYGAAYQAKAIVHWRGDQRYGDEPVVAIGVVPSGTGQIAKAVVREMRTISARSRTLVDSSEMLVASREQVRRSGL